MDISEHVIVRSIQLQIAVDFLYITLAGWLRRGTSIKVSVSVSSIQSIIIVRLGHKNPFDLLPIIYCQPYFLIHLLPIFNKIVDVQSSDQMTTIKSQRGCGGGDHAVVYIQRITMLHSGWCTAKEKFLLT